MRMLTLALTGALVAGAAAAQQAAYGVGDAVELEASGHWIPCVVVEPGGPSAVMRVACPDYPAISRSAGVFIVHNQETGLRRRGAGAQAPARPAAKVPSPPAAAAGGALKIGEYACYGSGGRPMIGLGFKVLPGGRYTDLEGGNAGRFTVSGGEVRFQGGHLGGQTGRDLRGHNFRIGAQASCEPW